jgi:hypothetical protein
MLDDIMQTMRSFGALFRPRSTQMGSILLPLVVMSLAWAVLRILALPEQEAFMSAFVLATGLLVVMRADGTIATLQAKISNRQALTIAVLIGPAALAVLIWKGDPLWCQRFLSVYFGVTACLYLLDVIDGRHAMVRYLLPGDRPRGADPMLSRVLAVCYMALVLLNETLIQQAPLAVWLVYFGLLPALLHRLILALVRTVDEAYAKGFGQF